MNTIKSNRDQYVVAHLGNIDSYECVVSHAVHLASMLKRGLILLYISDSRYRSLTTDEAEKQLNELKSTIAAPVSISYAALRGDSREVITNLPAMLGAVITVSQVDRTASRHTPTHPKEVLRNYAKCKTAYLTVQTTLKSNARYRNVAFTMDYNKECKEKLLWASYFARWNASALHALYHEYTDEGLRGKWYNNMRFLNNFLAKLNLSFKPHIVAKNSQFVDMDAVEWCYNSGCDLLIATTTAERDVMEYFIGTQEQRTIANAQSVPILYLNPREDLYVLCD